MDPKDDTFSFGLVLYEVCVGRTFFPQDMSNDSLVDLEGDLTKLCVWRDIHDDLLAAVFADAPNVGAGVKNRVKSLLRWCLRAAESARPTMAEILTHPLFTLAVGAAGKFVTHPLFVANGCLPLKAGFA
jgi:serine/threonine protein kinase